MTITAAEGELDAVDVTALLDITATAGDAIFASSFVSEEGNLIITSGGDIVGMDPVRERGLLRTHQGQALTDPVDHLHALADAAEDRVAAVEVRPRLVTDVDLGAAAVRVLAPAAVADLVPRALPVLLAEQRIAVPVGVEGRLEISDVAALGNPQPRRRL